MYIITAVGTGGVLVGVNIDRSIKRAMFIQSSDPEEILAKRKVFDNKIEAQKYIKENNLQMCEIKKV